MLAMVRAEFRREVLAFDAEDPVLMPARAAQPAAAAGPSPSLRRSA